VAPALAVGNSVVLKPASDTPITGGLLLAKIYEEAGLPPGVLSVVIGAGSEIGDAFVRHPASRVISFTGSTPVGRGIARQAAEAPIMKRLELELGGNSPFVVLGDADLDRAVDAAVFGKFLHQGQICMITNGSLSSGRSTSRSSSALPSARARSRSAIQRTRKHSSARLLTTASSPDCGSGSMRRARAARGRPWAAIPTASSYRRMSSPT
jgi:hypothetical protein